jgi:hypothetical protein
MLLTAVAGDASAQATSLTRGIPDSASRTPTYDAVVAGMSCKQKSSGEMGCEYKVGTTLRFLITGVGQADVSVTFLKVDEGGPYAASIAPLNGCVRVWPSSDKAAPVPNANDVAFVSTRDGKVYRSWNVCLKPAPSTSKKP